MNFKDFASADSITEFKLGDIQKICHSDFELFFVSETHIMLKEVYRKLNETSRMILGDCKIFISVVSENEESIPNTIHTIGLLREESIIPFIRIQKNITKRSDFALSMNVPDEFPKPFETCSSYNVISIWIDRELSKLASSLFWKGLN